AILFETGIYRQLNYNILVTSPQEIRIERIKSRDAISKEDIILRMKNQWDDEQKLPLANFVIINDDKNLLIPQVLKIHKTLKDYSLRPTDKLPNINL
ncbi:MAG: dephospho-CoA kinase, partial [Bacteroidota bacterium]